MQAHPLHAAVVEPGLREIAPGPAWPRPGSPARVTPGRNPVPPKVVPEKFTPCTTAVWNPLALNEGGPRDARILEIASMILAPVNVAPVRFAPAKTVLRRSTPLSVAPCRSAFPKWTPWNEPPCRVVLGQRTPLRFSRGDSRTGGWLSALDEKRQRRCT